MMEIKRHIIIDLFACMLGRRLNVKIKDRITLGIISGIIGNIAKKLASMGLSKVVLEMIIFILRLQVSL
jgi:hypothetical protein